MPTVGDRLRKRLDIDCDYWGLLGFYEAVKTDVAQAAIVYCNTGDDGELRRAVIRLEAVACRLAEFEHFTGDKQ